MVPEGGQWGLLRALQRPAVKAACPSTSSPTAWESQWSTDLLGPGLWELGLSPGSWVVAGHFPALDGPIQSPQGARVQCLPPRVTFLIKAFHRILSSFQTTQRWSKWEGGNLVMLEADRPGHPLQGDLQRPLLLRLPRVGAAFPVLPPKPPP